MDENFTVKQEQLCDGENGIEEADPYLSLEGDVKSEITIEEETFQVSGNHVLNCVSTVGKSLVELQQVKQEPHFGEDIWGPLADLQQVPSCGVVAGETLVELQKVKLEPTYKDVWESPVQMRQDPDCTGTTEDALVGLDQVRREVDVKEEVLHSCKDEPGFVFVGVSGAPSVSLNYNPDSGSSAICLQSHKKYCKPPDDLSDVKPEPTDTISVEDLSQREFWQEGDSNIGHGGIGANRGAVDESDPRAKMVGANAGRFSCDTCGKELGCSGSLETHKLVHAEVHTGVLTLGRTQCTATLDNTGHFEAQVRAHPSEEPRMGPFPCETCGKELENRSSLETHMLVHAGVMTHKCPQCDAAFSNAHLFTAHMKAHLMEKPWECDMCPARFSRSDALLSHREIHSGEKPFACTVCPARYSRTDNLTSHMRTHTGVKLFTCKSCPARFGRRDHLTSHTKTHTGDRPYACDMCPARFTQSNNVTVHKKIHSGERPFACDLCPATFPQRYRLANHRRTHSREKPYACDECPSRFSQKYRLTSHKKTHE